MKTLIEVRVEPASHFVGEHGEAIADAGFAVMLRAMTLQMEGSGCISMLKDDKLEDLSRMYNLFSRVSNGLAFMREKISNFVRETGKELVTDEEKNKNPQLYVQALLDLKDKYDRLLTGTCPPPLAATQARS
jgi:hypothetical protein